MAGTIAEERYEKSLDQYGKIYDWYNTMYGNKPPTAYVSNFMDWWKNNVPDIQALQNAYDTNANIISGKNRDAILANYNKVANALTQLYGIGTPTSSTDKYAKKMVDAYSGSMNKYQTWVDENLRTRPGVETQPEFANETRLNAGGNALGNNLRGRATSLRTLQDKRNLLDNILRALENKRTENSLNLSKIQEEAKIGNLNRQLELESKYGQYKINDINRDANAGLWNSVIGAGMSFGARMYQQSQQRSYQKQLEQMLKGGNYQPQITPADYTFRDYNP